MYEVLSENNFVSNLSLHVSLYIHMCIKRYLYSVKTSSIKIIVFKIIYV